MEFILYWEAKCGRETCGVLVACSQGLDSRYVRNDIPVSLSRISMQ